MRGAVDRGGGSFDYEAIEGMGPGRHTAAMLANDFDPDQGTEHIGGVPGVLARERFDVLRFGRRHLHRTAPNLTRQNRRSGRTGTGLRRRRGKAAKVGGGLLIVWSA